MQTLDLDPAFFLSYFAEGAANIVYRVLPQPPSPSNATSTGISYFDSENYSPSTPPPSEIEPPPPLSQWTFSGKLIRLRKDLSTTVPVLESHTNFEKFIAPLFPLENLVAQTLFHPTPALLKDCNSKLRQMEREPSTRPAKRHGVYLAEDEQHGCLVTDMSRHRFGDDGDACVEFKPKWLAQSPSAPVGSRRCRTCALRAMKRGNSVAAGKEFKAFCPLGLISLERDRVMDSVDQIVGPGARNEPIRGIRVRLLEFLYRNPLLDRLRQLQSDLDPEGVLAADLTKPAFLTAMTLRDCTLFLRVMSSLSFDVTG